MKVLHITNNYPTQNYPIFGIFVKEQIDSLSEKSIDNEVFFINGREKGKWAYFSSIYKLRKILSTKKYDIIHCHHALSALCYILSGRNNKSKFIVSFQNDPNHEFGKLIFSFIKKYANVCIFKNNSEFIVDNKSFYLPNGVNTSFFYPISKELACEKLSLDFNKKYILFISSNFIRKQKRYDKFKKVLALLKEKHNINGIEELVLTNTKRELIPYYFNAASLHLLTSDFEGSPNSVKEAMSCNLPVVSTNVGNVKELLENVINSFVSNENTIKELAEMTLQVLNSRKINNSRDILIEKKLDIQSVAEKLIYIYKN